MVDDSRELNQFTHLVTQLRALPAVGERTAQRMAIYLLEHDRQNMRALGQALIDSSEKIIDCQGCRGFSHTSLCHICTDDKRNDQQLCIVEHYSDMMAMENARVFKGKYFVLQGLLSPIDGVLGDEIGLPQLAALCAERQVEEIILAIATSVEGEATAIAIYDLIQPMAIRISRVATGVPVGGELQYVDAGTISRAIAGRTAMVDD